jgi:amino acid adenylation domain-containing protein
VTIDGLTPDDGTPDAAASQSIDASGPDSPPTTVVHLLAKGFEQHRDRSAVQDGDRVVTYAQLDRLSNQVAHHLTAQGVGPGDRVGLCIDRSIELVVGLVGILRSGASYVPLDPSYPRERLAVMREDARLRLVLASDAHAGWIGDDTTEVVAWSAIEAALPSLADHPPAVEPSPEDDAYVIFTSGSTGRPKGVELPHRALANLIEWQLRRRTFVPNARVLQYSSISFDVSFQEIATTLASGGHLFMIDDDERRDPQKLLRALTDQRIRRLFLPFVALRSLIEVASHGGGLPPSLLEVVTAGEQLRVDDTLRRVFADADRTLDNQYGPSETHVITAHLLDGDPSTWPDLPPIGRALDHCRVVVLDDDLQPVPDGQIGQIHLGGRNLAHGYFDRPDRTQEVFVHDAGGERLYRSGDLGSVDEAGDLHYVGRVDHQVKIRGHRVEPGEINAVGSRFPGVANCLTHTLQKSNGSPFLVTYYTVGDEQTVDREDLRRHLRSHLPEYMVPAFLMELETIGYGPSGKVDVLGLPDPRATLTSEPAYATDTQRRLGKIWADVLDFPNLPPDSDFFDMGGDSLAAVTLFLRINEEFGIDLPIATITRFSTLAALAGRIDDRLSAPDDGYRSMQLLADAPDGAPVSVLIHGGAGNVLIFAELAQRLAPDARVYGFQWSGWDGGRGERTISEMAEAYVAELRRREPEGPYRIGGHCIGGLIAIEVGRLLVESGAEVVGPLLVSDAPNLAATTYHAEDPRSNPDSNSRFERMADTMLDLVPHELRKDGWQGVRAPSAGSSAPPRPLGWKRRLIQGFPAITTPLKRARKQMRFARILVRVRLGKPVPIDQRELYCVETLRRAAAAHVPRTWPGDMVYFRAATFEGRQMALSGWWDDPFMGFGELCSGGFETHVVGGRHDDPLKSVHAAQVVRDAWAIPPLAHERRRSTPVSR